MSSSYGETLNANLPSPRTGTLLISLDFELYWGVRDQRQLDEYRENLLGVRAVIPALLDLFCRADIHATWATVGFLFCETREQLLHAIPATLPRYRDRTLSPYEALNEVGQDETADPYHFAPSLLRMVAAVPNQEIATHTFSHYYCLEEGQDVESFRADLRAAQAVAQRFGLKLNSIVFPRNQSNSEYLQVCRELGINSYRGNPRRWFYQGSRKSEQSLFRRGLRLLDSYVSLSGHNCYPAPSSEGRPLNLAASRFLRPYNRRLRRLEPLRSRRIRSDLDYAARHGLVYHLWWHPHNFGVHLQENLRFLEAILEHFSKLRRDWGMESLTMEELSRRILGGTEAVDGTDKQISFAGGSGRFQPHRL